jgi:hypothetical protein
MLRARHSLSGVCLVGAFLTLFPGSALAQGAPVTPAPPAPPAPAPVPTPAVGPAGDAATAEAKELFTRGSDLFQARKYAEALDALRASAKRVPSPNSGLMIARCLRELGRPVEALDMFTSVEGDARRRVADGEQKYWRTATSAATEAALVRAGLGSLRVRVQEPGAGVDLTVDDVPTPIPADGVAVVWHTPGSARVVVRRTGSPDQKQAVNVPSGGEVQMEFGASASPPVPPTVTQAPSPSLAPSGGAPSWVKPAIWASGAVTVAGFAVFTGFGLASQSEYNSLSSKCGSTGCTSAADRASASTGKQNQAIANVGVVVGSIAAASTLTFVVIALTSRTASARPAGAAANLRVGPGSLGLDVAW